MANIICKKYNTPETNSKNWRDMIISGYGEEALNEGSETDVETYETDLNMSDGDLVIESPENISYNKITIKKPEALTSYNILKGVNIAGIDGQLELEPGDFEETDKAIEDEATKEI